MITQHCTRLVRLLITISIVSPSAWPPPPYEPLSSLEPGATHLPYILCAFTNSGAQKARLVGPLMFSCVVEMITNDCYQVIFKLFKHSHIVAIFCGFIGK